jgi:hypothetical protein
MAGFEIVAAALRAVASDSSGQCVELRRAVLGHGVAASLRPAVWHALLGAPECTVDEYLSLVAAGPSRLAAEINNDLHRTLAKDPRRDELAPAPVRARLLNAYVHWADRERAAGGGGGGGSGAGQPQYVQGMGSIAMAVAYVFAQRAGDPTSAAAAWAAEEEEEPVEAQWAAHGHGISRSWSEVHAFAAMRSLLTRGIPTWFTSGQPPVHAAASLALSLTWEVDPELAAHVVSIHGSPDITWDLLFFSRCSALYANRPPLTGIVQLWDCLLAFGLHFVVLLCVGEMVMRREELLAAGRDAITRFQGAMSDRVGYHTCRPVMARRLGAHAVWGAPWRNGCRRSRTPPPPPPPPHRAGVTGQQATLTPGGGSPGALITLALELLAHITPATAAQLRTFAAQHTGGLPALAAFDDADAATGGLDARTHLGVGHATPAAAGIPSGLAGGAATSASLSPALQAHLRYVGVSAGGAAGVALRSPTSVAGTAGGGRTSQGAVRSRSATPSATMASHHSRPRTAGQAAVAAALGESARLSRSARYVFTPPPSLSPFLPLRSFDATSCPQVAWRRLATPLTARCLTHAPALQPRAASGRGCLRVLLLPMAAVRGWMAQLAAHLPAWRCAAPPGHGRAPVWGAAVHPAPAPLLAAPPRWWLPLWHPGLLRSPCHAGWTRMAAPRLPWRRRKPVPYRHPASRSLWPC